MKSGCKCRLISMSNYSYQLIRSARRTIGMCVKSDNSVIVSAPLKMPIEKIEEFINSKSGWLHKHIAANAKNAEMLSEIISYKKILVAGAALPSSVDNKNTFSDKFIQAKSLKSLKKLFEDNLGGSFLSMFETVAEKYGFSYGSVRFKNYKSKWGCCDRAGNISFNYKLLMLPEKLWLYVAVHELCHTVFMNHSKQFYNLVASVLPDYKDSARLLKTYSRITALY